MKAAILTQFNTPLEMREIWWHMPLEYGQVLVKVLVSGICGAQLAEIRGEKNPDAPLPRMLGHEACVEIIECGPGVKTVKPGQRAIAHWRKGDGIESDFPRYVTKEAEGCTAGLITTFATHSVLSENRLTAVPNDTPPELCALLGCGLSTALGTIENEADVKFGESVLIIGCGGLGLNLILAAKLRQASLIVSVDIHDKKDAALKMGATAFGQSDKTFFDGLMRTETQAPGFDVIIDTTGNPKVIGDAIGHLAESGRFVMVGQPKWEDTIEIPCARNLFTGTGQSIRATQGGRFNPSQDVKRYVSMWHAGRLNLDGLVSHRLPLTQINDGLDLVRQGLAGRIMVTCAE